MSLVSTHHPPNLVLRLFASRILTAIPPVLTHPHGRFGHQQPQPQPSASPATTTSVVRPASPTSARERRIVEGALSDKIPVFHARLSSLLGHDTPIYIDFNSLLAPCSNSKARVRAAEQIVAGLDTLLQGFELACRDVAVAKDISVRVPAVQVQPGVLEQTSLRLEPSGVVYTCGHAGTKMSLSISEVKLFFEINFYAKERLIVNLFNLNTLPHFTERVQTLLGREVHVICDVMAIAGTASVPTARLEIVR